MKGSVYVCVVYILSIGLGNFSYAQPDIIFFERFDEFDGLPNNLYKQVIQDRDGLLWMSGADGLARYNGYTIEEFRHNHQDTFSLSGNNINSTFEDSRGQLWVSTVGAGVNVSDPSKRKFHRVNVKNKIDDASFIVSDFAEDVSGNIWLASNEGLFILRREKDHYVSFAQHPFWRAIERCGIPLKTTTVFSDDKGTIWIGSHHGVWSYNVQSNKIICPMEFSNLPMDQVQVIKNDRLGRLWIGFAKQGPRIFFYNADKERFQAFDKFQYQSPHREMGIAFDLDNHLWVSIFNEGVYAYSFVDSTLFLNSKINSNVKEERFLRAPFVDHSGNVWISGEGFYVYRYPKGFRKYLHDLGFHQSNTCIYESDNKLWLAYREKGMIRLDNQTREKIYYSDNSEVPYKLPVNHIQKILKLRDGTKLILGFSIITILDKDDRVIRNIPLNGTNRAVIQDSKGRVWIAGYFGLHLFSTDTGVIRTYKMIQGEPENSPDFIQGIVEDVKGNIWFASDLKGLGKLNPETGEIKLFHPVTGDTTSLPSVSIIDMIRGAGNDIWLATDVALVRFNSETYSMVSYDQNDGMENDYICAVLMDNQHRVWFSTHAGISMLDPVTEKIVNYGARDGLLNSGYYRRSRFYSESGTIFFGGKNGVDYFKPDQLRQNPTAPRMHLDGVTIDNEFSLSAFDVKQQNGVVLKPSNKTLQIEFVGLHYGAPGAVSYQYKLEGLHSEWNPLGSQHEILFTNLEPGDYVFKAKAITSDSIESEADLEIPISVHPHFYATTWFRSFAVLLILGLLIGFFRMREIAIKRKDKKEADLHQRISELEKRALQAQMNPHFIYNSMNSIQQFMMAHDVEGAMRYLTKFSRILRTVLNMSAENRIPLSDEIKLIEDYLELENMRFPDKFQYEIRVSPELNIHAIELPPFFIQPQVENAIRHGLLRKATPGHLLIDIKKEDQYLKIVVEDDGIGRKSAEALRAARTDESKGLAIVEERLRLMHSPNGVRPLHVTDLYDKNAQAAGTRVEINLPLDD